MRKKKKHKKEKQAGEIGVKQNIRGEIEKCRTEK